LGSPGTRQVPAVLFGPFAATGAMLRTPHRRARIAKVVLVGLIGLAAAGAVASAVQPSMTLLPEGINGVPSCEDPQDVIDFKLDCDP